MADRSSSIALDPDSAFVRAIRGVREGTTTLDRAVDVLVEIEARHGFAVHEDRGGLANECDLDLYVGRLRDGQAPLSLADLVGPTSRAQTTRETVAERYDVRGDDLGEAEYHERVFPFLTESQLLLSGEDFSNDHFVTLSTHVVGAFWSWRHWGHVLAAWAEWSGWAARHGVQVSYVDFYGRSNLSSLIDDYEGFADTALACIRHKTSRLVARDRSA